MIPTLHNIMNNLHKLMETSSFKVLVPKSSGTGQQIFESNGCFGVPQFEETRCTKKTSAYTDRSLLSFYNFISCYIQ